MIYLLENKKGQWFKGFSYNKTKVNTIAEVELTTDVAKAWQFSHRHDAEDYINQQTHEVFTSQEFMVTEHDIVENCNTCAPDPFPEKKFVNPLFGDGWKENALKNYTSVMIADIALANGRKVIDLEQKIKELEYENKDAEMTLNIAVDQLAKDGVLEQQIAELQERIEELSQLCEGYSSYPEAIGGPCMYCYRLEDEH